MTLNEIKAAVDAGQTVFWKHSGYHVVKDSLGQYHIVFKYNGNSTSLTWTDGITLNGEPGDFFDETYKTFLFTVELRGSGESEEEAWNDAVEAFTQDPGEPHSCIKET